MIGGKGNDKLFGNKGADNLSGNEGDDFVIGGAGNDTLNGHSGNDTLSGGNGADYIDGGTGDDLMSGGKGLDSFVFYGANTGVDTILDFETGADRIHLLSQSASDTTISLVGGTADQYLVTHLEGSIFVTVTAGSRALLFDDLVFT
ncbi:MAG: hypothetical protein COC12_12300 [Rhodobacteraceae bacterium]|nr:MAG: hypothetical protein COC12_12300 [Paracoccaceae bacterium]